MRPSFHPRRALAVLTLALLPAAVQGVGPEHRADGSVPTLSAPFRGGEVIVKYRTGKTAASREAQTMKSSHGLTSRGAMFGGRFERLRLPSAVDVPGAMAMLAADAAVEYAEPNYLRRRHAVTPNDPLFSTLWGLNNSGQANFVSGGPAGTPGADMNMPSAWDADNNGAPDRTGRGRVTIAIIDDAFEIDHEDLADNMVAGYDFVDNDPSPRPVNAGESHGTAVAGAAAAVGGNSVGVTGAAWNERIMPLRFAFDVASQLEAFDFARLNGARIVNASFGGPGYSRAEVEGIEALERAGILFIASAGNQDSNLDFSGATYPANYRVGNVLAVAATNRQDGVASFSNYGPTTVPLAAPGLQIVTTTLNDAYTTQGISGTSFAAPYVAGIAALIRDYLPESTPREIKARLINSSEGGLDPANPVNLRSAAGRLNAATALSLTPGPSIVIKPQLVSTYVPDYDSGGVNVPVWVSAVVDDGGNRRLDPGEATDLVIALENLWLPATNVRVSLTVSDGVAVGVPERLIAGFPSGSTQTVRFPVSVPGTITGYRQLAFTLLITADGGYATTRRFLMETGRLVAGITTTERFESGLYDEFHTWVLDVPTRGSRLTVQSTGSSDVDFFVRYGEPAQYSIDLDSATDAPSDTSFEPFYFVNVPLAQRGDQSTDGNESVVVPSTQAGSYYITVVNYDRAPEAQYSLRATVSGGSLPPTGGSSGSGSGNGSGGTSGGGAAAASLMGLLGLAVFGRRRLRAAGTLAAASGQGLHDVPKP